MATKQEPGVPNKNKSIEEIRRSLYRHAITSQHSCTEALQASNGLLNCDTSSMESCTRALFHSIRDNLTELLGDKSYITGLMGVEPFSIDSLQAISETNQLIAANIEAAVESRKRQLLRKNKRLMRKRTAQTIVVEDGSDKEDKPLLATLDTDELIDTFKIEETTQDFTFPTDDVKSRHRNSLASEETKPKPEPVPSNPKRTAASGKGKAVTNVMNEFRINPFGRTHKEIKILSSYRLVSDSHAKSSHMVWEKMDVSLDNHQEIGNVFPKREAGVPASPASAISDIVESSLQSVCAFESRRLESWVETARGTTDESLGEKTQDKIPASPMFGDDLLIINKILPVRNNGRRRKRKKKGRRKAVNGLQHCKVQPHADINTDINSVPNKKKATRKKKKAKPEETPAVNGTRYGRMIKKPKRYDGHNTAECVDVEKPICEESGQPV